MKQQSLGRQFVHYLIPSVASLVSMSLYILADTFFIANGVGSMGITALNIVLPAYSLVNATALMLGIGAGVVIAVSRGMGDEEKAQKSFSCAVGLAVLLGAAFTLVGVFGARGLAGLLGASEQTIDYAATYLRVILCYGLAFLVNTTLVHIVRNDGNPRLAMTSMMANSFLNIILDFLFVMVLDWGMFGAAFATGFAALCGAVVLSFHWIAKRSTLRLNRLPDLRQTGRILRGGMSNFVTEMGNGIVILLFNMTLLRLSGDLAVAAYGIVANIALVISYVFLGIGQGLQPVVSFRYGQGDRAGCRAVLRMAFVLAGICGAVFAAAGSLFPEQMTAAFNGGNDPELAAITVRAIRIYFVGFLFMGFNMVAASYFQSMLQARKAMAISMLRACILVVAGIAVLPAVLGLDGVWMVAPFAEGLTLLAAIGCVRHADRQAPKTPETESRRRVQA